MTDRTPDPTLDRLLRHMAWANAQLIARLAEQPDDALKLTAPSNEWSAGRILAHLVNAAGGYAARLEGVPRLRDVDSLASATGLATAADRLAGFDARLRLPGDRARHPPAPRRSGTASSRSLDDPRPGDPPRDRAPRPDCRRSRHERQQRNRPRRDRPVAVRRYRGPGRLIAARSPQPRISRRAWSPLV
jgi:hypothetical protein